MVAVNGAGQRARKYFERKPVAPASKGKPQTVLVEGGKIESILDIQKLFHGETAGLHGCSSYRLRNHDWLLH